MIELEAKFPGNCIRNALHMMSASPEAFYTLRNNFVRSLAAICIAHWILGIGDRHISNFLVDEHTGELIGIDFNMSFGAGIRLSHLPELVPFRLTKQLVNAMIPFGTHGPLTECMAHVLRKLSLERRTLVTTLDTFIREPSINWLDVSSDEESSADASSGVLWMATQRIRTVSSKLKGVDPRNILEQELESGRFEKFVYTFCTRQIAFYMYK